MKKTAFIITLAALALCLAACGGSDSVTVDPNAVTADYGELCFTAGGCTFGIYDESETVLAALGEPNGTFEADSCAYQGKDVFYYYPGFELTVNDIDGTGRVTAITLTDDTVANPQGVRIGMDIAEAVSLMGTDGAQDGGAYVFTSGSCALRLRSDGDGLVTAIEYTAAD